jgi:nitrogen fixation NifU-like protein
MTGGALDEYRDFFRAELGKVYSETVVDHAMSPRNYGDLIGYNGFAIILDDSDITIALWLKAENGTITSTSFTSDGDAASIATGSMVTEMAKGKTVAEAGKISQQDIIDALGGLPPEAEHSALAAADAIKEAVNDYLASS